MKTHTSQFKQNLIKMGRQIKSQVIYGNTTLEDELFSVRYNVHTNLLKSAMKELEITSSVIIPENTVINYKLGLLVGNSYEYLDYGNYIAYKIEELKDENKYRILCYDKMLYAMKEYENMNITYPITIRDYINTICTQIGLTFANASDTFANYDKEIQNELYLSYDSTTGTYSSLGYTYRDVLDELAQVTASIMCINETTDELEIRYLNNTNDTINEEYIKDVNVKFGEKYGAINTIVLSRSQGTDNIYYPEILPQNPVELKIEDNQIMNWDDRSTYMPAIYNQLNGLEYYINDFESTGILYYEIGDKYNVTIGESTYNCVMLNDEIEITQGIKENIYTDMPEQSVTDYTKADKIDLKTNLIVDKQNGKIQSIVNQIGDRSQKTTTITQDIDGIESKVDELEDLTNTIDDLKTITITDGYAGSDILELHIYGNNSVFSYLYPADDLYPDDTLLPYGDSKIRFYNSIEDRTINLGIMDVLRQNGDVRDEVTIDYTGKVTLIRRINTDGTVKLTPETTVLGTLHFTLAEDNNTFEIVNYTAPISVKYATKSTYTEIFATKVEMGSEINQTAQEIDLSVNRKLRDYTTHQETNDVVAELNSTIEITAEGINTEVSKKVGNNEVISKINQSAEAVGINANKINLSANDVINILSGNEINLASKNITIKADDVLINNQGMSFTYQGNSVGSFATDQIEGDASKRGLLMSIDNSAYFLGLGKKDGNGVAQQILGFYDAPTSSHTNAIQIGNNNWNTFVTLHNDLYVYGYVNAANIINRSLEEIKKDIEKCNINAINEVKNTDIYSYRLKEEKDNSKKHLGIIIGDKYNYSKEIINEDNNGAELYSMISILWKAVQEQQEQIEQLQNEIKEMKGEK